MIARKSFKCFYKQPCHQAIAPEFFRHVTIQNLQRAALFAYPNERNRHREVWTKQFCHACPDNGCTIETDREPVTLGNDLCRVLFFSGMTTPTPPTPRLVLEARRGIRTPASPPMRRPWTCPANGATGR